MDALIRSIRDGFSFIDALGPVGLNALTAYFALIESASRSRATLLVSGAAGSVGITAAQIGKIEGCRVLAGGTAKCEWLLDHGCADNCIYYKSEDIASRIAALRPEGIDFYYFDKVGGTTLQAAATANVAQHA